MSRRRYLVERAGAGRKIRIEDEEHGPYVTQAEAATAAIDAAHRAGAREQEDTQVLVQRLDPTYRIVWTYGEDPFPPSDEDIALRLAPSPRGSGSGSHGARRVIISPPHRGAAG